MPKSRPKNGGVSLLCQACDDGNLVPGPAQEPKASEAAAKAKEHGSFCDPCDQATAAAAVSDIHRQNVQVMDVTEHGQVEAGPDAGFESAVYTVTYR